MCVDIASFACNYAQFDDVTDGREHVTSGHVIGQVLAGADAGVGRV